MTATILVVDDEPDPEALVLQKQLRRRFQSNDIVLMALFGPRAMSDLSPECAAKRTSADRSEFMMDSCPDLL